MTEHRNHWPVVVWAPLFVNGLMGEFVWPFITIILQQNGLHAGSIGVVLGLGNILPLLFRLPLGYILDRIQSPSRYLLLLFLFPLPLLLIVFSRIHDAAFGVVLALLLWVGRLPYIPLSLAMFQTRTLSRTGRKTLNSFVLVQHLFLGTIGLAAGVILYFLNLSSTLTVVGFVTLALNIWIFYSPLPVVANDSKEKEQVPFLIPGITETLMLLAFFSFHFINAPLLPFTELYLKSLTGNNSFIPWVSAVAETTMVIVALIYGRWLSRLPVTLVVITGFLAQPVRLYALSRAHSPGAILAIAVLDGLGAGLFSTTSLIWAREQAKENRIFNQFIGYIDIVVVLGGVLGSVFAGAMIGHWGFSGFTRRAIWLSLAAPLLLILTHALETRKKQ